MKISSLYTDESAEFVIRDAEKGTRVRFQIDAHDHPNTSVILHTEGKCYELSPVRSLGELLILETILPFQEEDIYYFFEISVRENGSSYSLVFTKEGISNYADGKIWFRIRANEDIPEWSIGAVVYQIFTDRFKNGNPANNVTDREYIYNGRPVQEVRKWSDLPEITDVGRMYGGDLVGVREKLDYLKKLGVEVLYLNPIFVSPSSHKYDVQDYDHIDPHLTVIKKDGGKAIPVYSFSNAKAERYRIRTTDPENLAASNAWFAEFVADCHKKGIRVIIDGVFNHCGSFNKWMDMEGFYDRKDLPETEKGASRSEKSRYRSYFNYDKKGDYEAWWDVPTLPKLNYEGSEELQEEIIRIGKKWVSPPYNVDGWRLDVAADLGHSEEFNHKFWKRFRKAIREANPEAIVLAEHYGDPASWISAGEWDTVMNYDAFMDPVSYFLTGVDKHSEILRPDLYGNAEAFMATIRKAMLSLDEASLFAALNQLDNHDHSRFLTRTNKRAGKLAEVGPESAFFGTDMRIMHQGIVMLMTWPGAPGLYYGDEAGVCGWTDPDDRRTYPWGNEDWELLEFVREMTWIHKNHPALRTGAWIPLFAGNGMIAYARRYDSDIVITIINTADDFRREVIDVSACGITDHECRRLMLTGSNGYNTGHAVYKALFGMLSIEIPPVSSIVISAKAHDRKLRGWRR